MRTLLAAIGVFVALAPQSAAVDRSPSQQRQVAQLQQAVQRLQVRVWNDEQRLAHLEPLRACVNGAYSTSGAGDVLTYQPGCLGIAGVP